MRNAGVSPVELSWVGEIGSAIVKSQSGSGHSTHNLLSDSRVPHIFTVYLQNVNGSLPQEDSIKWHMQ